jgi:Zn-dependent M16 (insulinase) family peptidase
VVLGNVLRNGFLHRVVREQGGAYGGGLVTTTHTAAGAIINCAGKQIPNHWEPIGVAYLTFFWLD